ncbi:MULTISPECIES: carboxymuconolactone decarboxylase family protein [unclassified Rathayibacter]|uniref:carboxymuconolactone decarboxylase family protein n=1 Tax=unclassified Rathayibacter TaxID=2609250 RepID=UPI0006FB31D8|nr:MULTISPECIES: carboxymuconolactone decarboxylase family protein [unclassified Rathayibacter]KQQ03477.1 hypothetical protein ASF42_08150 [Rathayibacter sp. Leaf294]KQS11933.1 hypothetical protein ASG06_08150 [Rathayibacter sp. Leaf185]
MPDLTPGPPRATIGEAAPQVVDLTEKVLDVRERPEPAPRDRSLVTIASLVTGGSVVQLESHVRMGRVNGLIEEETVEIVTRLAFRAGRPKALSAIDVAQRVFAEDTAA